jgi:uncharacterized damage-inducible protein DinB
VNTWPRHARALTALAGRLTPEQWESRVQGDDGLWTARQALAHLVVSEPGQLATAKGIATGGAGVGGDFDLDRWNNRQVEKQASRTVAEMLAALEASRRDVLAALDALSDEQLERRGRHARGDELTVEGIFYRIGEHEADHVALIEQASRKC